MKEPQKEKTACFVEQIAAAATGTIAEQATKLYFRNNPDGTLRWVWPASLNKPLFLKFYNTPSRRARLLKAVIQLMFRLRLQRFFASGCVQTKLAAGTMPYDLAAGNWAIFAGTPGIHQTALVFQHGQFHKIPTGSDAAAAIVCEYESLNNWSFYLFRNFEVPAASLKNNILTINDIGRNSRQSGTLSHLHWNALEELSRTWSSTTSIRLLAQWQKMQEQLGALKKMEDKRIPVNMIARLELLAKHIDAAQIIPASVSHGDFTPWNIFVQKNRLGIIDWELGRNAAPCLTDAFHFLYQQTALVEQKPYRVLHKRLSQAFEHPVAKKIISEKAIDMALHHRLYLLFTVVSYLCEYAEQEHWRPQVGWSIKLWNEALNAQLLELDACTPRQLLLHDLFDYLQDKTYAVLKWKGGSPAGLSIESDLDICMQQLPAKALYGFLHKHPLVKKISRSRRSFMTNYGVVLNDGSFLSIDAIWTFKRKNIVMMDAAALLGRASFNAFGVKTPAVQDDFTYTWLFYLLNGKSMPGKYCDQFSFFSAKLNRIMEEELPWKKLLGVHSYRELFHYRLKNHDKVAAFLQQQPANKGWWRMKNKMVYGLDVLREHRPRKGFTITFSGVDGAGKSTVIETIKHQIQKRYRRKTVVLRHRPALLPMLSAWKEGRAKAERLAAQRLPRQGRNKSTVSSLLRFAYYFTDYLFGQFVVYLRYTCRGYVVIYDRYYFDFINDGKRSNILLPASFTRSLYRLLLKPRFNFFLYADAETIIGRKKELDKETISRLTGNYLDLFNRLDKRHRYSQYVAVENNQLPETLELIHNYLNPAVL